MPALQPGDAMPDITLVGPDGPVKLRDLVGKTLVVYFYPKDETFGCTIESCGFRDHYHEFTAAGADVIGVSQDDAASHARFKAHYRLPFTLLSDPGGLVGGALGGKALFGIPGRTTFVFDEHGVVRHRFDSQLRFSKHVEGALESVKALAKTS